MTSKSGNLVGGSNGFKTLSLSEPVYNGIVRLGFRVRQTHIPQLCPLNVLSLVCTVDADTRSAQISTGRTLRRGHYRNVQDWLW
jgi:hypothetical protein